MDKHHTFVNTMIALDLATRGGMLRMLVVQKLSKSGQFAKSISFLNPDPKVTQNQKNVQSVGFHTCFRYGNIVIPMVFALALFMHSKILPQIF